MPADVPPISGLVAGDRMDAVGSWDLLRIIHLLTTLLTPALIAWIMLVAKDRRQAMDNRLDTMDKNLRSKMADIDNQLREMKGEMREARKECAEDIRAIMAQISEYPRRRELQENVSELWRAIRLPKVGQ
jgi:septal ring factor EnvC (AmiA/AmiB activator)